MQQIFDLGVIRVNGLALKVGDERLVKLRSAADSLSHKQRIKVCRIPLQHLSLLPFLNGPCCLADMIHCVSEFAQHDRDQSPLTLCLSPTSTVLPVISSTERSVPKTPPWAEGVLRQLPKVHPAQIVECRIYLVPLPYYRKLNSSIQFSPIGRIPLRLYELQEAAMQDCFSRLRSAEYRSPLGPCHSCEPE